ncbi:Cysteine-rich secretory protein [Zostera marina]|uniref:Cysteine-rich secretory protein n=1 Tax=Zostera marina TaxID=29655 RepID=A0A0K9PC63_ZOSMR|nr:Cysteine-rich secretory protein [Zostera marina]
MVRDNIVTAYAQNYANSRRENCKPQLKLSGCQYGENLFAGYDKKYTAIEVVAFWVSEKQWYNYTSNSCASDKVFGHYIQVVWKNSNKLGYARVKCNSGSIYVICSYSPLGNYIDERPY